MSIHAGEETSAAAAGGKRVLVAEDSPVTQDLLKLVLNQRGHTVDIAADGEQALAQLGSAPYDVALLDFHLPKLDGLQVAAAFRSRHGEPGRPRLVAITADIEGLLARQADCENFDHLVAKPLDIHEVCAVVEEDPPARNPQAGDQPEEAGSGAPAPRGSAGTAQPVGLSGFEFLHWPDDFDAIRMSPRSVRAMRDRTRFDAILLQKPASLEELGVIWQRKQLHVLPVVDMTGALRKHADFDASGPGTRESGALRQLVDKFRDRRVRLHDDLLLTDDLGEKMLARIFVRDDRLSARYDPDDPGLVAYRIPLPGAVAAREADILYRKGFLQREFFDRLQVCDRCGSSRFTAREECPHCRSADLVEESYLHHFRCAYQGPESDFRRGDTLICPKCARELSHFSVDYDKPGFIVRCCDSEHVSSEPRVGLVCLDCGAHYDGDAVASRDVYSYRLTDRALDFLEAGHAFLGPAQQTLRFSALPLEIVVALNEAARAYNESRAPFALLDIAYRSEREIVRETGVRQFEQARELFLENLRSLLGGGRKVVAGQSSDFALLPGTDPEQAREEAPALGAQAAADLRLDLGVAIHVFGPEDFT